MTIPPYPVLSDVDDPIAEEEWPYTDVDGAERTMRIKIGRPVRHWVGPATEIWYCPVFFEHRGKNVTCIKGVGPATALANAGVFVNSVLDEETVIARGK